MNKETKLKKMFKRDRNWDQKLYSRLSKGKKLSPIMNELLKDKVAYDFIMHKWYQYGPEELFAEEINTIHKCEEKYGWK